MAQTKHETEDQARVAARRLGKTDCQIIESKSKGQKDVGPWVFYLETDDEQACSMVRSWERLVYSGPGDKA